MFTRTKHLNAQIKAEFGESNNLRDWLIPNYYQYKPINYREYCQLINPSADSTGEKRKSFRKTQSAKSIKSKF